MVTMSAAPFFLIFLLSLLTCTTSSPTTISPLSPQAYLLRYWSRKIPNSHPIPPFLLSKASPLSTPTSALFERLASSGTLLPANLHSFCSSARLLCHPNSDTSTLHPLSSSPSPSAFSAYQNTNFTNYGTAAHSGVDSFTNYSNGVTLPVDSFRRYSRDSSDHSDRFSAYSTSAIVPFSNFTSYATSAASGSGEFTSYGRFSDVTEINFTNYDSAATGRLQTFLSYSDDTKAGGQSFAGYGKKSIDTPTVFSSYGNDSTMDSSFSGYAASATNPKDTFTTYAFNNAIPTDTFRSYSDGGKGTVTESFSTYSTGGGIPQDKFASYAHAASNGSGDFKTYQRQASSSHLGFTSYDEAATGRLRSFSTYADSNPSVDQSFSSYGDDAVDVPTSFANYANGSDGDVSFSNYGKAAINPNDTFTSYSLNTDTHTDTFKSYADGAKGKVTQGFASYSDQGDVRGEDSFESYAKQTANARVGFTSYVQSSDEVPATFQQYGKQAVNPTVTFKTYGFNSSFTEYSKVSGATVTFADYRNTSSSSVSSPAKESDGKAKGKIVKRWVEPGKFFRESQLSPGTVMPMPDIRDRKPIRAFLPRSIAKWLPFSTARFAELSRYFNATEGTGLWKTMGDTIRECEREPSRGETKRCATSIEDMVDFATSVLGSDVVVRTTESTKGSGGKVQIGRVHGINGGRVTKSVSCHQSLFPYMVYYCHSVPKVRVYEAEIMTVGSGELINHGVAICHLDTSAWSEGHGSFIALGHGPGKIEVCHWIFEGDMTWAAAD